MSLTSIYENSGSIPGLARWVRELDCDVRCRHGSDLVLLWLWPKAVATAPIRPLAGEPPHAASAALKRPEKKKIYVLGNTLYIFFWVLAFSFNITGHLGDLLHVAVWEFSQY